MVELSKNVDAPTSEAIVEHQIVDAPTLQVKVELDNLCFTRVDKNLHEEHGETQLHLNFCKMSTRQQLRRWLRCRWKTSEQVALTRRVSHLN